MGFHGHFNEESGEEKSDTAHLLPGTAWESEALLKTQLPKRPQNPLLVIEVMAAVFPEGPRVQVGSSHVFLSSYPFSG